MAGLMDIIAGAVSGLGETAVKIRTAITGIDPAKQAELTQLAAQIDAAKAKAETDLMQAQIDLNKQEAANQNLFVSGWRPGLGWLIVAALAMKYVLYPFAVWIGLIVGYTLPSFPVDDGALYPLIVGMLGLATTRTVEKINSAQGNH